MIDKGIPADPFMPLREAAERAAESDVPCRIMLDPHGVHVRAGVSTETGEPIMADNFVGWHELVFKPRINPVMDAVLYCTEEVRRRRAGVVT